MGFQVHGAKFPPSHAIFDASEEAFMLLFLTDLKPVLHQDDTVFHQERFKSWTQAEKVLILLVRAKIHHVLHQCAVVPAAVE